ncbi:Putative hydrolase [Neorhizobium galegae bv. officinalis]|uniref:Putative hydrolase n=1 Tax=Neorhizobium galegae bv. officinalis TaxID=323656 RepID=A0A0T7F9R6_NEOGA|nr:alpha/beta hydrolase [Neorhizobium galegae]CDZ31798.1 Putative hydrolase [Neorhizobium galegae bv. officinalis]
MTTLVLIPGLVSDAIVWAPLAEAASGVMPVHHADLSDGASITGMARTLLDETDGDIVAVGHSMGGRVALEMARMAPDRVRGLVLANTGHHPKREGEEIKRQQMIDLGNRSIEELAQQWLPPMLDPARVGDKDLIGRLHAMVLRAGSQVHERQIRALIGRPDASAYIADLRCPILLVAARQDGWSPIAQHQEIADAAPDAELVIIENAGHFAPVERPVETTAAITEWLARRFGESQ